MTKVRRSRVHSNEKLGSPDQGEPVYLAIAKIRKPHGVTGEMLATVLTDFPQRITPGRSYWVGAARQAVTLEAIRFVSKGILIRFAGIMTPEAAGIYRNQYIYASSSDVPELPEDEYYHHELIALQVVDEDGLLVGEVSQIITTGANDVYVVIAPDGNEILLPAIESVILQVEPSEARMVVRLPEWE
ncbi:MAG: 16S rRNA processing protein RimM [Anaerolineae bacterium]|nr:16S rRNA processing protein RimM [Anaerolineae bacterium]